MRQQDYLPLYIGCQIWLADFRFAEPVEDQSFTLYGVVGNKFIVEETGLEYEMESY